MDKLDILSTFKTQIKKKYGTRYAVFGTISDNYPNLRNVIVRDLKDNIIYIYTHALSNKVLEINNNSNTSLCWYSHKLGLQLQFYGKSNISDTDTIKLEKSKVKNFKDYLGLRPGSIYAANNNELHFIVIEMHIEKLVALKLDVNENIKYEFDFLSECDEGTRLIP